MDRNKQKDRMKVSSSPNVEAIFSTYPDTVRSRMLALRSLIIDTAKETKGVTNLEETLKWGEPSYVVKHGSTVRIDWKEKNPDQYAIYFTCTTDLVPTFKKLYSDILEFKGNRAIVFQIDDELPEVVLKRCIAAALRYHKVKKLPILGL